MVVVDIRNFFTIRNVELIEINYDTIYYAEEKNEEGHNNLFVLEYNRETRRERIIANYSLDDPTFVQHLFSFEEEIILLLENSGGVVWVFRLNKRTGEETAREKLNCIGDFCGCAAVDSRHLILFTEQNEECRDLFLEYKKVTGLNRIAYLHDIDEGEKYFIKDERVCRHTGECIHPYQASRGAMLLLCDPYGDEAFKRRCYDQQRWISAPINDSLWVMERRVFLEEIKGGAPQLSMKCIAAAGIEGMARYIGMDAGSVYFRATHFPSGRATICTYDKEDGRIKAAAELPAEECGECRVTPSPPKAFFLKDTGHGISVKGLLGSAIDQSYDKKLGDFLGCVEDRFIITRKVMTDELGHYSFEYTTIFDTKKGTEESFECKGRISGNTLVLY